MDTRIVNPDPGKYVVRRRKGKWILVDRQVISWSKNRYKPYTRESKKNGGGKKAFDVKKHNFFE